MITQHNTHWLRALACLFLAVLGARSPAAAQDTGGLRKSFEELDAKGDQAAIVALWKANPGATLAVIDSYLEGSMKLMEKNGDAKEIEALQQRALRGARAADTAHGQSIFSDYASSFVGWTPEQRKSFRGGQRAFSAAMQAAQKKDWKAALAKGEECLKLARPLGDWWGTAMGLSVIGDAQEQLGTLEAALEAHSQARLIYHSLGLAGDEYGNLRSMAALLGKLDRRPRALNSIASALALADALGDAEGRNALLEQRAQIEEKSGDKAAAEATRKQIKPVAPPSGKH